MSGPKISEQLQNYLEMHKKLQEVSKDIKHQLWGKVEELRQLYPEHQQTIEYHLEGIADSMRSDRERRIAAARRKHNGEIDHEG